MFLDDFLKGVLKVVTIAGPLALFGGGLTGFFLPCSLARSTADKMVDNFAQTEIFQELKAEDEAELAIMKKDLDVAQEKHEKGEMSVRTYLDMKYDYEQKLEEVNSRDYIISAMEKYDKDIYVDYKNARKVQSSCMANGMLYALLGGCATAGLLIKSDKFQYDIDYNL